MSYVLQRNTAGTILHIVRNVAGTGTVTGKAANLTYTLRDESGNTTNTGLTIAEQGTTGYYNLTFTPDNTGNWLLSVTNPSGTDQATYDYAIQVVLSAAGNAPSGAFLTTTANLKERLGISGTNTTFTDAYLANVIARATQRIEKLLNRPLVSASYTEYVDGDGTRFLNLSRGPITVVTSVAYIEYNATTGAETATTVDPGSYFTRGVKTEWILPGYLEHYGGAWSYGQRNYRVIYTAGFTSVPYDLEQACLDACVAAINRRKDMATTGRDIGNSMMAFLPPSEVDAQLMRQLAPYMSHRC